MDTKLQRITVDITDTPLTVHLNEFVRFEVWVENVDVMVRYNYHPAVEATQTEPPHSEWFEIIDFSFSEWDLESSLIDINDSKIMVAKGKDSSKQAFPQFGAYDVYKFLRIKLGDTEDQTVKQELGDQVVDRFQNQWEQFLENGHEEEEN
tara:strand:- start:11529 stop:11978 length:450 start_codon:yes stop_codon:yes gene_type:complete